MIVESNNYFGELAPGECFFLVNKADKHLLMKIEIITNEYGDFSNAVSLKDGVLYPCEDDMEIIPVRAARVSF